jgi:hypothetical protein
MKKVLCKIFGHLWLYGEFKGMQHQPTLRACTRCGKVQNFYGSMTRWEGTFGQLWYSKIDWRSESEEKKHQEFEDKTKNKFKELTKNNITNNIL